MGTLPIATSEQKEPAFNLGYFVMTKGVSDMMNEIKFNPAEYLHKHIFCDWSDMCKFDQEANQEAIDLGDRIFSAYKLPQKCLDYIKKNEGELISDKIYIVTEADRSFTTMLFPSEY